MTGSSGATGASLDLTAFGPEHLSGACALSREAGWPHRSEDWALTLSVSEGVVAIDRGRVVGTALCTIFGQVASLSMIIVAASHRGRGLGRRLMEAVIGMAGAREKRLIATAEGLPLYERLGLVRTRGIAQHQGLCRGTGSEAGVRLGGPEDMDAFLAADLDATGMDRGVLLRRIAQEGELLMSEDGVAMIRDFGRGRVLGPVVARDAGTARRLIAAAAQRCNDSFLRIDLPEAAGLGTAAEAHGLARAGGGTLMVRDAGPPRTTRYQTFALVSQALG